MASRELHDLFVLNVALQLFDGVATWHGVLHWPEGNPLLRGAIAALGPAQALLLYKAQACGWLLLLRRSGAESWSAVGMAGGAGLYLGLSYVPWMLRLLSLAWR